jgi:CRISPR-associated protein Cas2
MLTVFTYDVVRDRERRRVAAILEAEAVRVQYSVFEARLDEGDARDLAERVARELGPADTLRVYTVGADGLRRCRAYGGAPIAEPGDYWLL